MGHVVVTTDPSRADLAALVADAIRTGEPFPPDSAAVFDAAHPADLFDVLRASRLHTEVVRPPPGTADHLRKCAERARKYQRGSLPSGEAINLSWLFKWRLRRGYAKTKPACAWYLNTLRRQWHHLLSALPDGTARRLAHVLQVQATPAVVREHMAGRFAITFSHGRASTKLPPEPVPLALIRVQWVFMTKTHLGEQLARLGTGSLAYDRAAGGAVVQAQRDFAFATLPGQKWQRRPADEAFAQPATLENGLACHAALEAAAVTGHNILREPCMPVVLVAVRDPVAYGDPDMSDPPEALLGRMLARFNEWWRLGRDPAAVRSAGAGDQADRPFPFAWVDLLVEAGARLTHPVRDWPAAAGQLGDLAEAFAWGVWLSEWQRLGRHFVLRADLVPASFGDPLRGAEAFVVFPPETRGRPEYRADAVHVDFDSAAAQVVEPPPTAAAEAAAG